MGGLILRQDKDLTHIAKVITKFLWENIVTKLPKVTQSPDLNSTEHPWD
jgi:hypothetical protein